VHKYALLAILCIGCGWMKKDHLPVEDKSPSQKLLEKYEFYLAESAKTVDSYGFVGEHCDSLLYTSLAAHAGLAVDVFKAEKSPGEWLRHPDDSCWPAVAPYGSDSTISKDMLLGLLVYLAGTKNAAAAQRVVGYGQAHNWFMGTARTTEILLSKCFLTPTLQSDYKKLASMSLVEQQSSDSIGVQNGYRGHLDVVHIYASSLLYGGISGSDLSLAKAYCESHPRNALYCAVSHRFDDGNFERSLSVLLDETLFPADRLPSSSERCAQYLWSTEDTPSDWAPCAEGKTHQGIDFLIAARVILGG
jgi:hypothetical protein